MEDNSWKLNGRQFTKDHFTNPLHSRNGSNVSKFKCGLRGKGNTTFNLWWAYEFLALGTYESWMEWIAIET